jgi:cell division initiation protein
MRISPIDIQQQKFKSRAFGYDKAAVDQFLEMLAEELERLIRRNQDLKEELDRANTSLAEMKEREETLKQTLVTTQKVTDELKSTARREVDVMMAEAEVKAERLMQNAEERRLQLIEEIQEIKRQKVDFEVGLRGLLEKHIRMLDLNTVAIEQQDADSRLLEEPLPFVGKSKDSSTTGKTKTEPARPAEKPFEDAEYAEAESQEPNPVDVAKESRAPKAPELTFDFDPTDDEDEEDLLK